MFSIKKYSEDYFEKWNTFIGYSNNGTIFHRQDFLNYHKQKFINYENHLMWFKGQQLIAVMPMAIFEADGIKIAKSPYGGSYGGIITREVLNYSTSNIIAQILLQYLTDNKINEIFITPPIKILENKGCDTLLFSLLEQGFKFCNSDISSVVNLGKQDLMQNVFTSRARNMARKAKSSNIEIKFNQPIADFWKIIELTFDKHGTKPTHTYKEWEYLCQTFPFSFWNDIAYMDDKPIAGIGHVKINKVTDSSFYLCCDPEYSDTQALTLLICESLLKSKIDGFLWFDFGTSSFNMKARENIFRFKESFGAVGVFRNTIHKIVLC
jgi:hypothetical protein